MGQLTLCPSHGVDGSNSSVISEFAMMSTATPRRAIRRKATEAESCSRWLQESTDGRLTVAARIIELLSENRPRYESPRRHCTHGRGQDLTVVAMGLRGG